LKEPQEKCNQFSYFEKSSFFEETSKQIQGNFLQTCCTSNFLYKKPHAFSDVKSGGRAKLNKNEITTSKQEMKIGISKKVRGQKT
jgi:hypothetical protein